MTGIKVKLDKERIFKFNHRQLAMFEEKSGKSFAAFQETEHPFLNDVFCLLWAGLVHEDPGLTVDHVIDLIDEYGDLEELMEAAGEAVISAFEGKPGKRVKAGK